MITQLIGGIGLFLLGMSLITDSLKALAGDRLNHWLTRFTGSPSKAMYSGIGLTLVVQSSNATMLATIGFVSAGILTFTQAMGVIIGANIGTTSTGWMVAFLGVKFSIASIALPIVGFGALLKLLAKDKWAQIGLALAGFGLIFWGIDVLQTAMDGLSGRINFSQWGASSLYGQIILIIVGFLMTVLLQSSSAAITATLAALVSGAIDLPQALNLVIGQNIGTILTPILAAMGGTISAQRTAAVHVVFNILSAILAFFILVPVFLYSYKHIEFFENLDPVVIVALFHTLFSVFGACFFIPFIGFFEKIIVHFLPEKEYQVLRYLDLTLYSVPSVAIAAARNSLSKTIADIYFYIIASLKGQYLLFDHLLQEFDEVIAHIDQYLDQMPAPQNQKDQQNLLWLFRLIVYIKQLRNDLILAQPTKQDMQECVQLQCTIGQTIALIEMMIPYLTDAKPIPESLINELHDLYIQVSSEQLIIRQEIVNYAAKTTLSAARTFEILSLQRWLEKLLYHTVQISTILNAELKE